MRVVYGECVMRTMYGETFFAESEPFERYERRLTWIARALHEAARTEPPGMV